MATFKIRNVRVFDDHKFGELQSVAVANGKIVDKLEDALEIDGREGYLLPGLIDAHIHLHGSENLTQLCRWGVTTGLDMASFPPAMLASLRSHKGVTDIRSAGTPASTPGSMHSRMPGFPQEGLLEGFKDADKFVECRVNEGSDYIKVIADIPGPDQATLDAVVQAAHRYNKLCVAHAARYTPFAMAQQAGVDIVTHAPLDQALRSSDVKAMLDGNRVAVPTLIMMKGIAENIKAPFMNFNYASQSVTALHKAGVTILAGTDANTQPGSPSKIPHGESLHQELELLIEAGMSSVEVLRAATVLPAQCFGLEDRGSIMIGKRADLLLLAEDPIKDIRATRSIQKVWCCGSEVTI